MQILAINTTGQNPQLAYLTGAAGKSRQKTVAGSVKQDQDLILLLQQLVEAEQLSAASCQRIAVFTGPGRFTWIRSGLVVAKTLALLWQLPLVAPSVHQLLATQTSAPIISPAILGSYYLYTEEGGLRLMSKAALTDLFPAEAGGQLAGWGWDEDPWLAEWSANKSKQELRPTALALAQFALTAPAVEQEQVEALYLKDLQLDKEAGFKTKLC